MLRRLLVEKAFTDHIWFFFSAAGALTATLSINIIEGEGIECIIETGPLRDSAVLIRRHGATVIHCLCVCFKRRLVRRGMCADFTNYFLGRKCDLLDFSIEQIIQISINHHQ